MTSDSVPKDYRRRFFDPAWRWSSIGAGEIGGKAAGLTRIDEIVAAEPSISAGSAFTIAIPRFVVLRTGVFDEFIAQNSLAAFAAGGADDSAILQAFLKADIPVEYLGDLRSLMEEVHVPLAVRSSSLLEDAIGEPFAGVYATKMLPNNQPDADIRFRQLMEAIKLVYASTFVRSARDYLRATGRSASEEKMAVVIQEVVGTRHADRFYPEISGIARSYNFYTMGRARPEDGVVCLALGLGKTIVDGGNCWSYTPKFPLIAPPFASPEQTLELTQSEFWAVNMGKPPDYDPTKETEYMSVGSLSDAECDGTLPYVASTFDTGSGRIYPGLARIGPRIVTFAGLLADRGLRFDAVIARFVRACEERLKAPVEIEFAATLNPAGIGLLQVRPMVVAAGLVDIPDEEMRKPDILLASDRVLGNGAIDDIRDIIYVKPESFDRGKTPAMALEIETFNRRLLDAGRRHLLIGYGRWGSSDPWLGIPVNWGQVSAAGAIAELSAPSASIDLSQGSHFFHNLTSFRVSYFSVSAEGGGAPAVNWEWLNSRPAQGETGHIRHVRLAAPLRIRVDGRTGRGVIAFPEGS